jgi:diguanylate cyclase
MANLAHVVTQPDGSFESWSDTLPDLLQIKPDSIITSTRRWVDLVHPEDRDLFRRTASQARADRSRANVEYRLWRSDGVWMYLRQVMEPIPGEADAQGRTRWFNTIQDITASKHAELRIKRLSRVHAMLSGINSLIIRMRNRDDLYRDACNIAVEQGGYRMAWIGLVNQDAARVTPVAWAGHIGDYLKHVPLSLTEGTDFGLVGSAVKSLDPIFSQDVRNAGPESLKREASNRGLGSVATIPLLVRAKAVGVFALYAADAEHFDEDEKRLLLELSGDVSFALDHIEKSEKAEYLAFYDPLTELANRTLFYERLAQQLAAAAQTGRKCGLVLVDIERFKNINDSLGRQAGDALLRKVSERITALVPALRVSRVGADHFAVVVPDLQSTDDLALRSENRIKDLFGSPYLIGNAELNISARLGISVFPDDGPDAETIFRNAEAALKKAKATGEQYLFYEQRMSERAAEQLTLESKLRRAVELDQFVLHYQPKVQTETREILGVEALLRWQDPEKGLVPPLQFIPLLEKTGLILSVGAWAIKRAAADYAALTAMGLKAPRIAVNVSAIQLRQSKFVAVIEEAMGEGPRGVDLEITESVVMHDVQATIEKLKLVRSLGVELAIDDFGTGYSSLAYLAKLPVQSLKIDRSFISTMQRDPDAMTMVSTMISLARSMRLKVVAEGVETEEQANILRLVRCDELQGYLFSKAVPMTELVKLLQKGRSS